MFHVLLLQTGVIPYKYCELNSWQPGKIMDFLLVTWGITSAETMQSKKKSFSTSQ